jgi:hypothetical protein
MKKNSAEDVLNITQVIASLGELKEMWEVDHPGVPGAFGNLLNVTWNIALYARGLEAELRRVRGVAEGAEKAAAEASSDVQEALNKFGRR